MTLNSSHHQHATTRLRQLQGGPEEDILRHVLQQMATGNIASIPVQPITPKPKPQPKPEYDGPTWLLVIMDRATGLARIMSSRFDMHDFIARHDIDHDPASSYAFKMIKPSAARSLVSTIHAAFHPQRRQHPTISGAWFPANVAAMIPQIILYNDGEMGVVEMSAVRDSGLRYLGPAIPMNVQFHERYPWIMRDYLLVTGHGLDDAVIIPDATFPLAT